MLNDPLKYSERWNFPRKKKQGLIKALLAVSQSKSAEQRWPCSQRLGGVISSTFSGLSDNSPWLCCGDRGMAGRGGQHPRDS